MVDNTALYNLKAVINEVGMNPVTLRAWERRYDLLKPKRTPGGHRLYSRQDIEMLKWLIERQVEGLSISSAMEMWKNQHQDDLGILQHVQTPVSEIGTGESILDILRARWILACLAFDDQGANRILDEAFAVAAPEMIIIEVIQKGLVLVGERWHSGSISVQQEHFTSAIAVRRINTLLLAAAPPTRPGVILVACPPGEEHDFILLIITFLLRRRGWDVVYLGSNVPLIDLDATIRSTSPVLFLSGAQTLKTAASLKNLAEYIVTLGVAMAYGGGIFDQVPAAIQCVSGYYLGTDLARVPPQVEQIITSSPSMPIAQPVSLQYIQILSNFVENEAVINAQLSSALRSKFIKPSQLENTNLNFSQFIASALTLGDISLVDQCKAEMDHLHNSYGLTASWVSQYYAAYFQAVEHYLGEDGAIILDWFAKNEIFV
jgi:DNA-binding transcriptional MerR regulator